MTHVTEIKGPDPSEKKGVLKKVKESFVPPKTEEQLRESFMIKKWKLKKDPSIPHRYWIDDRRHITFIPGDEESISKAEEELEKHFRAPKIESTSRDVSPISPYAKKPGQKGKGSGGVMDSIRDAADQIAPFAESASRASSDLLTGDLGFNPKQAEKSLMSTEGVMPIDTPEYRDFVGSGSTPKKPGKKSTTKKKNPDDFGLGDLRAPRDDDFL